MSDLGAWTWGDGVIAAETSPPDLSRFKLVYLSGHGGVYCDGAQHIDTYGGHTKLMPFSVRNAPRRCDCDAYRQAKDKSDD